MILSGETLKRELAERIKIEPFRLGNLSGTSYDVTLDAEFLKLRGDEVAFIDPENLKVVGERTFAKDYILQPKEFVLAKTEEWLEVPENLLVMISGKSSLARLGLQIESAYILHPGHTGHIILEITNNNSVPFKLVKGMKIAQLVFMEVTDPVARYANARLSTFKTQRKIELPDKLKFSE